MLLNPVSASRRVNWIVIELDAGPDSQIGISVAQTIDLIEVDSGMITIVIGETRCRLNLLCALNPPKAEATSVCTVAPDVPADACGNRRKGAMKYWSVEVLEHRQKTLLHHSTAPCHYGTARNFCRIRSSGYWGKKTSAIKTLFGVSSRVAIVSLYSMRSCGLTKIVPGFSVIA